MKNGYQPTPPNTKSIKVRFEVLDQVRITALECDGVVISIWVDTKGVSYQVRYFHSGDAKQVYFYDFELEDKKASQ